MLPSHHALRALLGSDFDVLSRNATFAPQIEQIMVLAMDSTLRIMRELAAHWNTSNARIRLPAELLAYSFTFLSFRDRITASHVSQTWRSVALDHPAVWARIELSSRERNPLSLLSMALDRSGQLPLDLVYGPRQAGQVDENNERFDIAETVERSIHRMRTIEWNSRELLSLQEALPRLASLKAANVFLSPQFLSGRLDKLHTLHLPVRCLPVLRRPLYSIKDFAGSFDKDDSASTVSALPHLFQLFPNMEVLTLSGLHSPLSAFPMPRGPLPQNLVRLRLFADSASPGDVVDQYLAWSTAQLSEVELLVNPSRIMNNIAALRVHPFFLDAVELSIGPWKEHRVAAIARDPYGRARVLAFDIGARTVTGSALVALARAIWFSISETYTLLSSVSLTADELNAVIDIGNRLPLVHTLIITLPKVYNSGAQDLDHRPTATSQHARCDHPWQSLSVLGSIPFHFPSLVTFILQLHSCCGAHSASMDDARVLLKNFAEFGVPRLPVLRVRGLGPDVVRELDPRSIQQLPMKVEFE